MRRAHITSPALLLASSLSVACSAPAPTTGASGPFSPSGLWIVSASDAALEHERGATFLDARTHLAFLERRVSGSVHVAWEMLSDSVEPLRGRIQPDDELLTATLQALGVDAERTVVVVGAPGQDWGEDGRIAWTLRAVGHDRALIVDGGFAALLAAGVPTESGPPTPQAQGAFSVHRRPELLATSEEVRDMLSSGEPPLFIDTRERREYDGETPYGESRGGHIPGAVHLHYRELLDDAGFLLDRDTLTARLAAIGASPDREIVAYCTGGIRSGWLVVVLRELGFARSKNFAGSMWEWAAGDPGQYPLE